jgi:hypothetical protein
MDALGNDGNASMPEQVNRPNPRRKMMMKMIMMKNYFTSTKLKIKKDIYCAQEFGT